MKFLALVKPCRDCPFDTAVKFPLGIRRRSEIAEGLRRGETFFCHKTVNYDDDALKNDCAVESRCFGAASVLHKNGLAPMQAEQVAVRLGIAQEPREELLETDRTYGSLDDFVLDDPETA
ncbi:hypothetical protein [Gordonia alkanivorans]|uniref:hypothetical protein n=1 Tax=Gordonia alkanivorans TaxID=84096 RepID=UPI0012DE388F|nr:hypothetical protein [Gordonia alkanivorans]